MSFMVVKDIKENRMAHHWGGGGGDGGGGGGERGGLDSKEDEVVPRAEDVSLVDGVLEGAFGGDGDDDFAMGEGPTHVLFSHLDLTVEDLGLADKEGFHVLFIMRMVGEHLGNIIGQRIDIVGGDSGSRMMTPFSAIVLSCLSLLLWSKGYMTRS
ncbi:hypothetical protein Tco_1192906 [Tanacetum coccineum]